MGLKPLEIPPVPAAEARSPEAGKLGAVWEIVSEYLSPGAKELCKSGWEHMFSIPLCSFLHPIIQWQSYYISCYFLEAPLTCTSAISVRSIDPALLFNIALSITNTMCLILQYFLSCESDNDELVAALQRTVERNNSRLLLTFTEQLHMVDC